MFLIILQIITNSSGEGIWIFPVYIFILFLTVGNYISMVFTIVKRVNYTGTSLSLTNVSSKSHLHSEITGVCSPAHNSPTCCSSLGPCQAGEGGCSNDNDCAGSLVCGKDNCKLFHANASAGMNCCVGKY